MTAFIHELLKIDRHLWWRSSPRLLKKVTNPFGVSDNKLVSKIVGISISIIIQGLFLVLTLKLGANDINNWLIFTLAGISLIILNKFYLKLIENLFDKLNQK